jgi:NTE family protein
MDYLKKIKKIPAFLLISLALAIMPNMAHSQVADTIKSSKRPTVGLVLSGGGAKGFAYIGLLKVIQEAGLPVDYIGGTSIGSIIGGLYAIGYHPDSIAKMVRSIDWDALLTDQIERKYIAYEEKEFGEKFIITLPITNKSLTISTSLYQGQEISLLLNHYFSPAFKTRDFDNLQTPFLCMGTDLFTGSEVLLDSGYLPLAIRASMSIPGYFSPVDYAGYYLVDGGVVNNFPVKNVKERGPDIIVSGDVQPPLRSNRDEFTSLTGVMDQIITFNRGEANRVGYEMSDIYIPLDTKYGIMDFADYDSIIAFGEQASRPYFNRLKAVADSLNAIEYKPLKTYTTHPIDKIHINSVQIKGYKKFAGSYFKNYFNVKEDTIFTLAGIEKSIRQMYGTRFFEQVNYEVKSNGKRNDLIIRVQEANPGYISAGVHYDGSYGGSLLLTGSFRNVLGKRTKLFTDLVLGENPRIRAFYMLDNGAQPGIGARAEYYSFKFNQYEGEMKINKFIFTNYKVSAFINYSFKNLLNFRGGFDYEYFRYKQDEPITDSSLEAYNSFSSYGTFFGTFSADSRNRAYFPTAGSKSELHLEYVMPLSKNWSRDLFTSSLILYWKYELNYKFAPRFVFRPGLFLGSTLSAEDRPPRQHAFGFGGLNPSQYVSTFVPFTGLQFIQRFGYHAAIIRMKLQYNFYKKLYMTFLLDAGSTDDDFKDVYIPENYIIGYGAAIGYDSFIGPLELTFMGSNLNSKPMLFLNLGFWF